MPKEQVLSTDDENKANVDTGIRGTVKWFSEEKGYGYIVADDGKEHYFNIRDIQGANLPRNGDVVSFESGQGKKDRRHHRFPSWPNLRLPQAAGATMTEPHAPIAEKKMVPRISRTGGGSRVNLFAHFAVAPTKILVGALLPLPFMVTITPLRLSLSGASTMKPSSPLSLAACSSLSTIGFLRPLRNFLAQNLF